MKIRKFLYLVRQWVWFWECLLEEVGHSLSGVPIDSVRIFNCHCQNAALQDFSPLFPDWIVKKIPFLEKVLIHKQFDIRWRISAFSYPSESSYPSYIRLMVYHWSGMLFRFLVVGMICLLTLIFVQATWAWVIMSIVYMIYIILNVWDARKRDVAEGLIALGIALTQVGNQLKK